MFSLFPNSDAPLAGWAIEHSGVLAFAVVAMILCAWLALRESGSGGRRVGAGGGGDLPWPSSDADTGGDGGDGGGDGGGD